MFKTLVLWSYRPARSPLWRPATLVPKARTWSVAFVAFILARSALAGPPYVSDDPEPTDYQHFEIYTFNYGTTARGALNMGAERCEGFPGFLLGAKNRDSRSGADRRAGRSSSHGPPVDAEGSRSHYRAGETGMAVHASLYVPSRRRSRNRWAAASMIRRRASLFSIVNLLNEPRTSDRTATKC
jgi:hypothetical protein